MSKFFLPERCGFGTCIDATQEGRNEERIGKVIILKKKNQLVTQCAWSKVGGPSLILQSINNVIYEHFHPLFLLLYFSFSLCPSKPSRCSPLTSYILITMKEGNLWPTLVSLIIVQVGIKVQVGKISKINNSAGWNKAMQVGILGILLLQIVVFP